MSIDESVMGDVCQKFKEEYSGRAKCLGYNYFQVSYSKTAIEKEEKPVLYVLAEFHRPLFEKRENKEKLRKLIPRKFDYEGDSVKVFLEYVKLPYKIRKQLSHVRKFS